jgi:membrane associated rhomboid family serine protease
MPQYYYRQSSNPVADFWRGGVAKKLILINVAVFIVQLLLVKTRFTPLFALIPRLVVTKGYVWQVITYMFLHGGFFHLALNMFIVWMFGSRIEAVLGSGRFMRFYLICGIGGAAMQFAVAFNGLSLGASAAVYGILLAYAIWFPNNIIYVFGVFPVKARNLVIVLAAAELLFGLSGGDGVAHFAHLGGMAAGLIYLRSDYRMKGVWDWLRSVAKRFPVRIHMADGPPKDAHADRDKIDSILDKINRKGYENLTETERRILENYSQQTKRH